MLQKLTIRLLRTWLTRRLRTAGWTWSKINTLFIATGQDEVIYSARIHKATGKEQYTWGPYHPRFKTKEQ